MNIQDKVAIVTGASSGIGEAIARALAAQGTRLVLTARREEKLVALQTSLAADGASVVVISGDITVADTARRVAEAALTTFGRIDILVNNAGFSPPLSLLEMSEEIWDITLDSCLKSVYLMTRAVLPAMLRQGEGRILQMSSVAGKNGYANRTAYCAAKWGIQGFSEALRDEVGSSGIRVHTLHPAAVATDWWETTDDPQSEAILKRMMQPEEIAQAAVWMLAQPDHIQVNELVLNNARNPWQG